jgi:hypothetical protein
MTTSVARNVVREANMSVSDLVATVNGQGCRVVPAWSGH